MPDITHEGNVAQTRKILDAVWDGTSTLKVSTTLTLPSLRAYPKGQMTLDLLTHAYLPVPMSNGRDGYVYCAAGSNGKRQLCRTNDGFATMDLGADFNTAEPGKVIVAMFRTSAGFVTILSSATAGSIYYSATFGNIGTKVLDTTQPISKMSCGYYPGALGVNEVLWVGEYSQNVGNAHILWVSHTAGASFFNSIATTVVDPAVNAHVHCAVLDNRNGRMYVSFGDGPANRNLLKSEKLGLNGSWTALAIPTNDYGGTNGWDQATLMMCGAEGIYMTPDSNLPPMITRIPRDTSFKTVGGEAFKLEFVTAVSDRFATAQWFAMGPYAQKGEQCYFLYPKNIPAGEVAPDEYVIMGSGDDLRSWYPLWGAKMQQHGANVNMREGLVGPDAGGFVYGYLTNTLGTFIAKFTPPAWLIK